MKSRLNLFLGLLACLCAGAFIFDRNISHIFSIPDIRLCHSVRIEITQADFGVLLGPKEEIYTPEGLVHMTKSDGIILGDVVCRTDKRIIYFIVDTKKCIFESFSSKKDFYEKAISIGVSPLNQNYYSLTDIMTNRNIAAIFDPKR